MKSKAYFVRLILQKQYEMIDIMMIHLFDLEYRGWSDNTFASSCERYRY